MAYVNSDTKDKEGLYIMKLDSEMNTLIDSIHLRNTYVHGLDMANIGNNQLVVVWSENPYKIYAQILNYNLEPI